MKRILLTALACGIALLSAWAADEEYAYGNKWYGTLEDKAVTIQGTDYTLDIEYVLTALDDSKLQVDADLTWAPSIPEGVNYQFHFLGEWSNSATLTDGHLTWTSTKTYELGNTVNDFGWWFALPGGGLINDQVTYTYGAANEKPVVAIIPKLKAAAQNITATTAEIAYSVTLPEELTGAVVKVYFGETEATASPIALTGLTAQTDYSYTLRAVATKDGKDYTSKDVTVTFTTTRDANEPVVWHTIVDGLITNAYLIGEDAATSRRSISVSIETSVSWNPDGSITVDAIPHGTQNIVGFVPKIKAAAIGFDEGRKDMTKKEDGSWTYTTELKNCPENADFAWMHFWPAYDGGECTIDITGYKAGESNSKPEWGSNNASLIDLNLSADVLLHGDKAVVTEIAKNENGHYLPDGSVQISVSGSSVTYNKPILTTTGTTGISTITATSGECTTSKTINVLTDANSPSFALTDEGASASSATAADVSKAFDNDEGTTLDWRCADTQEHNLTVNLGSAKYVLAVQLVWEGACAKDYILTLSNEPAASAAPALREAAAPKVFTETGVVGGGGLTIRKNYYNEDFTTITANKVALDTQAAHDAGWGIRLKEMKILYSPRQISTDVENVMNQADALVDVYNLQGVRVLKGVHTVDIVNLPAGIYIANGRKFIVK